MRVPVEDPNDEVGQGAARLDPEHLDASINEAIDRPVRAGRPSQRCLGEAPNDPNPFLRTHSQL